jgi:hypothetical protein
MMKETKEREKQTKMEIDQGLAEILQGDQTGGQVTGVGTTPVYGVPGLPSIPSLEVSPQGGPQTPAGKNVATQAAISAADATQPYQRPSVEGVRAGLEAERAKGRQRELRREQLDVARIMGLAGKDATDWAQLMSTEFPNEQARVDAIQQRFPKLGMTEMQRLQVANIEQGMRAREQEMAIRGHNLRQLEREEADMLRVESVARTLGQDPRLFRREFKTDLQIQSSHNSNSGVRSALDLGSLYAAEDVWASSAAGEHDTTRERVLATVRPLNEQWRDAALSQYRGGVIPDELVSQLSGTGQLAQQANTRLTRRWYEINNIPLTTSTDDLSDEDREDLIQYVKAGTPEEARVLREAYRIAYRHGAVDTNLFRGVGAAEFPAVRPATSGGTAQPTQEGPRTYYDPRARALDATLQFLGQYMRGPYGARARTNE